MKKILTLFSVGLLLSTFSPKVHAQSEVWAGGHIAAKFVGTSNDCNQPTPYIFTLHFYRDFAGTANPLPDFKVITLESEKLNLAFTDTLSVKSNEGPVNQYCLNGNPVATEGVEYSSSEAVLLDRSDDWRIRFQGTFRSPENNNIFPGQGFGLETRINNEPCGSFVFENETYENPGNSTVEFVRKEAVASFCSGINKRYSYQIPAFDPDKTADNDNRLNFGLTTPRDENMLPVMYDGPYSSQNPFPSSSFINFSSGTGVISFTPNTRFTSTVTYVISEQQRFYKIEYVCEHPSGDCDPNDPNKPDPVPRLVDKYVTVSSTMRDMRFVFDNNCNSRLPDFEGVELEFNPQKGQDEYVSTYNAQEDAYEYDCGTTAMTFNLTNAMFCETLDKNDFRIGLNYDATDSIVAVIDSVIPTSCNEFDEFDQITIYLHRPIGPGEYNIFFRYGDNDSTTILNRCAFDLPIDDPWTRIYINNNYDYEHPFADTTYCDPASVVEPGYKGIKIFSAAKPGQNNVPGRAFFTWQINPNNPNSPIDTIIPGSPNMNPSAYFNEDVEQYLPGKISFWDVYAEPPQGNQKVSQSLWEVGAGLDFSIYNPYTGDTISEKVCYATDRFRITRYENPPVDIPDYDLCPEDEWPVVNLDSMVTLHNANADEFVWKSYLEYPRTIPNKSALERKNKWITSTSGTPQFETPGALVNRYNIFASIVPLQINNFTCFEKDTFLVVKEDVRADIGVDSTICPGDEYVIRNDFEYLVPDSIYFQWYFNDQEVVGNTTDTILISERGEYKLEVIKNTPLGTFCIGRDSININVADSLYPPEIFCENVTFENGQVKQRFVHTPVEGADQYELRSISPDGTRSEWGKRNNEDGQGLGHNVIGEQMRVQVRPINNEVPETADCYYGPASNIAEACEVIIKPTNVFTPNGDGINDFLAFDLLELYPGSSLQVFNRWGKLIYEDDSYYNDWDGEDNPAGTYFYILDINDPSYGIFKGNFTIIRD